MALQLARIMAVTNAPIALTSDYALTGVSLALGGLLGYMTMTEGTAGDAVVEASAIQKIVITSDNNRMVRIAMGVVQLYGAYKWAQKHQEEAKSGKQSMTSLALEMLGLVGLCAIAFIWLGSGYYGQ